MSTEHKTTESEIKEIWERLTSNESSAKSAHKRIDDVEKKQNDLADLVGSVKVLADREARVEEDVNEIKTDVKELKQKPIKRYETVVTAIITTICGGVIGYLVSLVFH
jgi:predicted  nucleic acid-binding Zn-ribbon protein